MAATVLNTPLAVEISVYVVRAFVKLREVLASNHQLAAKLMELEQKVGAHDMAIVEIIETLRQLLALPKSKGKRSIGFSPWKDEQSLLR